MIDTERKYATAKKKRQEYVDSILDSSSQKKIVVAGPGTGKTYLFKCLVEGKNNTLTLTFVNSLIEDLSLELYGISDVRTLHGFARSVLGRVTGKSIKVFPDLAKIVNEDAKILLNEDIDFEPLFHNKSVNADQIIFYRKRMNYYEHYGYSDIVFAAVRQLENNKERIPVFQQVVVDEFQDFNLLEVSLIDLLAEKSPILLAGDDDQALYEQLKSASPTHIRHRYKNEDSGYTPFCLPYCSRCTSVIVNATNDVIDGATKAGYLKDRIKKEFYYFNDENKDCCSMQNPQLIYSQFFERQIPWFIQKRIEEIAKEIREPFTVLIISPIRKQSQRITEALRSKGFKNIQFVEKDTATEPTLLDGLKLLLKNKKCNLGWRITAKHLIDYSEFENLLKKTYDDASIKFSELINTKHKQEANQLLTILRAVSDGKQSDDTELESLLARVGLNAYTLTREHLRENIKVGASFDSDSGIRKTHITATTVQSSKGLAADYVFITHFDDQYYVKDKDKSNVTDQDICKFLVALTRAKKKAILISSDTTKTPLFLQWIDPQRIQKIEMNDDVNAL